jgi:hypothetical protein
MTPLTENGVAINLRFLEKERISIAKRNQQDIEDVDQEIIDKGNAVAHGGNDAVHASLFQHGYSSEEHKLVLRQLYRCEDPEQYLSLPPKLRQALDIHVSVFAEIGIHSVLGTAEQREAVTQVLRGDRKPLQQSRDGSLRGEPSGSRSAFSCRGNEGRDCEVLQAEVQQEQVSLLLPLPDPLSPDCSGWSMSVLDS